MSRASPSCPTAPITAIVTKTSGWTSRIRRAGTVRRPVQGSNKVFAYIVRRLALMLVTLFGISVIIFVLLRIVPGNIVDILFDAAGFVNPADKARLEAELGLDKSLVAQYASWIGGLARGDLGFSYVSEKSALAEILPRIPITARLAALAL